MHSVGTLAFFFIKLCSCCLTQLALWPLCDSHTCLLPAHLIMPALAPAPVRLVAQIQFYNFNAPGFAENTGHFTQLIWRDTAKIGCAANLRCSFRTWICQFTPAGRSRVVVIEFPSLTALRLCMHTRF